MYEDMKKDKVFIVVSNCGQYEDYSENIEKVFDNKESADEFAKEFDDEHFIDSTGYETYHDAVYNIMPDEVYYEWPVTESDVDGEDTEVYADEFRGYTIEDYEKQEARVNLSYEDWGKCRVEVFEVEE